MIVMETEIGILLNKDVTSKRSSKSIDSSSKFKIKSLAKIFSNIIRRLHC